MKFKTDNAKAATEGATAMNLYQIAKRFSMLTLGIALGFPLTANAQDVEHGRVSFADESALVRGAEDDEWSYATLNSIVLPGDTIWADEAGALELEFAGGAFVRLADGSRVDIISTPPQTLLQGWTGSFYVQRIDEYSGDTVFETPAGRVHIEPSSLVRIDILEDGPTAVSVRTGGAIIYTDVGDPVRIAEGERSYIDPGYMPSEPDAFDRTIEDSFDEWNRERARAVVLATDVPIAGAGYADAPIGVSDLNSSGEWVTIDGELYWKPYAELGYVPYRDGRWSYAPAQGYVWVGHRPFSYVTSHHGYWHHHHHHGWIWAYHRPYSPAYVFSVRYGDYFLWAPIGRHGYPVHVGVDLFDIGGFTFSFGFSFYSNANNLFLGYHRTHAYHHHHHHHHDNYHYWNIHRPHGRHQPHLRAPWPGREARLYPPSRVSRGPSRGVTKTALARERADVLSTKIKHDRYAAKQKRTDDRACKVQNSQQPRQGQAPSTRTNSPTGAGRTKVGPDAQNSRVRDVNIRRSTPASSSPEKRPTLGNRDAEQAPRLNSGGTKRDSGRQSPSQGRSPSQGKNPSPGKSPSQDQGGSSRPGATSGSDRPTAATAPGTSRDSYRVASNRPSPESVTSTRGTRNESPASRPSPSSVRSTRSSGVGEAPTKRSASTTRTSSTASRTPKASASGRSTTSTSASSRPSSAPTKTRSTTSSTVSRRSTSTSSVSSGTSRSTSSRSSASTSSRGGSSSRSSVTSSPSSSRSTSSRSTASSSSRSSSTSRSSVSSSPSRSSSSRSSVSSSPSRSSSSRSSASSSARSSSRSSASSGSRSSGSTRGSASGGRAPGRP